ASAFRSAALRQLAHSSITPALRQPLAHRSPLGLVQRSAFQTSSKLQILPPLPQVIKGSVNDPVRVPDAEPSHGSYHWTTERLISAALVPLTVAPFAAGSLSPLLDGTLIGLTIIHSFIGFQACITDYFPKWRVPFIRKTFDWLNVVAVFLVSWGWYEFETNDVGLTGLVKRVWT
ncbi:succinate dehydrogenase flavo protein subunit, partial [Teratosphaeria nubilosa]